MTDHSHFAGPTLAPDRIRDYSGGTLSRSRAYELLKAGKLEAVRLGRRTCFLRQSIDDYLLSLPRVQPSGQPANQAEGGQ
ncbi:MAG: helix-turn-helix domain-containing protein [Alphaproteobacteria bacterium]|nr:helix-turn-helix domain-containing protein [Alphaproteobacteria bacterium]